MSSSVDRWWQTLLHLLKLPSSMVDLNFFIPAPFIISDNVCLFKFPIGPCEFQSEQAQEYTIPPGRICTVSHGAEQNFTMLLLDREKVDDFCSCLVLLLLSRTMDVLDLVCHALQSLSWYSNLPAELRFQETDIFLTV